MSIAPAPPSSSEDRLPSTGGCFLAAPRDSGHSGHGRCRGGSDETRGAGIQTRMQAAHFQPISPVPTIPPMATSSAPIGSAIIQGAA
jgi:hypothetical protein